MSTEQEEEQRGQVRASFENETPIEVWCERIYSWAGPISFPPSIPAGGVVKFGGFESNKGGVWYTGQNTDGVDISWIVAWDAPEISTGAQLKVFVMCGTKIAMEIASPIQILARLEQSSDEAHTTDVSTKTTVEAKIVRGTGSAFVDLSATFGLVV